MTSEEVANDQWLVASSEESPSPAQTTNHKSQITSVAKRPWCGNLRLRYILKIASSLHSRNDQTDKTNGIPVTQLPIPNFPVTAATRQGKPLPGTGERGIKEES